MLNRAVEGKLSLSACFEITAISYGLNKILPANSGDLARSKITERYTTVDSHGEILGLVAIERLLDVGALCLVLAISVSLLPISPGDLFPLFVVAGALVLVGIGFVRWADGSVLGPVLSRVPDSLEVEIRRACMPQGGCPDSTSQPSRCWHSRAG